MKKYLSENAIKDRLRNLALEQKREFNNLLKQLYLERFLARSLSSLKLFRSFCFQGWTTVELLSENRQRDKRPGLSCSTTQNTIN